MPRAINSTSSDMSGYAPAPSASSAPMQSPAAIAPQSQLMRSNIMLASLPGISSGPDAVIRQFNGGRSAPQTRLYVP